MRGHWKQSEARSPGLFNVSSNEQDDGTEQTLINFIDDTPLRPEGHLGRTGLEFQSTPVGLRDRSETNQMRFEKDKSKARGRQPHQG